MGLACIDGICGCLGNDTVYTIGNSNILPVFKDYGRCTGLAGGSCFNGACINGAICTPNKNICACKEQFFENSERRCVEKLEHSANCSADNQCQNEDGKNLICLDGKCKCDPKNSIFGTAKSHKTGLLTQCLGTVTNPCINGLCAPRSYCFTDNYRINPGKCTCESQFALSQLGNCKAPHGGSCTSTEECIEGLVCGKTCRCRYDSQEFNAGLIKCVSPVGLPCDDLTGCTYGAECVKIPSTKNRRCKCMKEFVETAGGTCRLKFGVKCTRSSICVPNSGLECIEGRCQCSNFKKYDSSLKKCVGLIGAPCNLKISAKDQCVENTECLEIAEVPVDGRCTCSEGFEINNNYTCTAKAAISIENSKKSLVS